MENPEAGNIIFHLEHSEVNASRTEGVYAGKLLLTATVKDLELWEQVIESFSRLRLFKGEELKTTLINMLQQRSDELEKQIANSRQDTAQEIELARHRASLAEAGRTKAEGQVKTLEAQVESLKDALCLWQDWHDRTVARGLPG